MALNVVIDNDIHGWGDEHEEELQQKYSKIIKVGRTKTNGEIVIPADKKDEMIGNYCFEKNCDVLTGDKTAHTKYFKDARLNTVQITQYAIWDVGKRPIYLIKIL